MFDHMMQLLSEEMMECLYPIVLADKEYAELHQVYKAQFNALEKAISKDKRKCFCDYEEALNALSGRELEIVYQKGL
ncbi:MAG: hypothetical protein IJ407_04125 [Clostridia bacterium]|nr:hypothetical protein [Clostridia bacterium]